jgi:type IV secretory pathway TrbD component
LFQDKISIRAIVIDANKIWYAADKGRFGFIIWIIIKNLKAVLAKTP